MQITADTFSATVALQQQLDKRITNNQLRTLNTHRAGIDFFSNDYLGFSKSIVLKNNAEQLLNTVKANNINGSTGSRLISGTSEFVLALEKHIASFHAAEAALIYNSGFDANIGLFSSIPSRNDTILYDELIHASIIDGIRLSNAKRFKFKHNNVADLERLLLKTKGVVYVVVESVYSMDGDSSPLTQLAKLCEQYGANLIVDEAHATGVFGENGFGKVQELGLQNKIFARVHTFSKALGCHGAVVVGSNLLRNFLINFSRSFIYTTAMPLHTLCTIQSAYGLLQYDDSNIKTLKQNIISFKKEVSKLNFIESESAIQCVIIPGNLRVKSIADNLIKAGMNVKAIMSPTVAKGSERLRICLHSYNTQNEIEQLVTALEKELLNYA